MFSLLLLLVISITPVNSPRHPFTIPVVGSLVSDHNWTTDDA